MRKVKLPIENTNPLWNVIDFHSKYALIRYQRRYFNQELNPPCEENPVQVNTRLESTEQIGQIMRQAPSNSRGKED